MSDALPTEKCCSKCGETKPLDAFYRKRQGYQSDCKACVALYRAANAEAIREQRHAHYVANADKLRQKMRADNAANADKRREQKRAHYAANAETIRDQRRASRTANAETIREQKRAHYAANADKLREQKRAHYAANINKFRQHRRTESYIEYQRAHRASNPDLYRAKDERRRALKKGNGGDGFTASQLKHMRATQGGECAYCAGLYNPDALTADHIIPIAQGGRHEAANMCLACPKCNSSKGNRTPDQWINRWYYYKTERIFEQL